MTTEEQAIIIRSLERRIQKLEKNQRSEPELPSWITPQQASELVGLSPETLRKYARTHGLKTKRRPSGRGVQYHTKQLEDLFGRKN